MTRASFTTNEIEALVKGYANGGSFVAVPSYWRGKKVRVTLLEPLDEEDKENKGEEPRPSFWSPAGGRLPQGEGDKKFGTQRPQQQQKKEEDKERNKKK